MRFRSHSGRWLDHMITIQQIPLEKIRGKRILVLIDPNIEKATPTLGSLIGKSAKVVVATHVEARPGQNPKRLELDFAKELSHSLGLRVTKLDHAVGAEVTRSVLGIKPSEIVLLENLSIYQQDAANESAFARQLASICDLFVDDAFEVSHRTLASNVGITRWKPIAVAGPWLASRVKELEDFAANPPRPLLAIVGGSHIETKLSLLDALMSFILVCAIHPVEAKEANEGNSGRALVNAEGRLIGIRTAILSRSGGNQGIGFAIPANMARNVMDQIIHGGKVSRAFPGVLIQPVTPDLAKVFKLGKSEGALISDVSANSPAERAGLSSTTSRSSGVRQDFASSRASSSACSMVPRARAECSGRSMFSSIRWRSRVRWTFFSSLTIDPIS